MALTPNPNFNDYQFSWQPNQVQQSLSTGLGQMLGYDSASKTFDTSKGSLLGGPGNAFSAQDMSGISAQARQGLGAQRKANMAGLGQASAARGTGGMDLGSIMASQMNARDNAALAATGLQAKLQGLEMGTNQYNARAGMAGTLGNLASAEQERELTRQKADLMKAEDRRVAEMKLLADQLAAAKKSRDELWSSYLVPGTQKGGFKEGEKLRDEVRRSVARYDAQIENLEGRLANYQQLSYDPWQTNLNMTDKYWYDDNGLQAWSTDLDPRTRATEADKLYTNYRNFDDNAKDAALADLLGQIRRDPASNPSLPDWLVGDQREDFQKDFDKKAKKEREKLLKAQQQAAGSRA